MTSKNIVVNRVGSRVTISLNRPEKLNALDVEMLDAIDAACVDLENDLSVRVVTVVAAGERAFCVGADIDAWAALKPSEMSATWIPRGHRVFNRLAGLPQPVIAVVQGHVLGGGLELAMAADLRVASTTARFGLPEVKLGTVPGWGGTARLAALIGPARARQMIFSGAAIDAPTALLWGLANEVVSPEHLKRAGDDLADLITRSAPLAVRAAKRLLSANPLEVANNEAQVGAILASTADLQEGLTARREKRPANFRGL